MASTAKHRVSRRSPFSTRRVAGALTAGAAAIATFGATAPAAHADGVWDRVAACESGGNWSINTGNGFYGGLQFTAQTWRGYGGGQYAAYAHQASKGQQIAIAQKVLVGQGPGAWPVCSVQAGLTRGNGGAGAAPAPRAPEPPSRSRPAPSPAPAPAPSQLVVDGIRGPLTTKAVQAWVGTTQDGIFGPITTRALQQRVGTPVDGIWGPNSQAALQDYLGIQRDGSSSMNAYTVRALQRSLNAN